MNEPPDPSSWESARQTQPLWSTPPPPPPPWSPAPQADTASGPRETAGYQIPPPSPPSMEPSPPRRPGRGIVAAVLAGLLGAGVGTGVTFVALDRNRSTGLPSSAPIINANGRSLEAVSAVAKAVLPIIVRIDVSEAGGGAGTGSGVIYRPDGYIVTNNHVVEGASEIQVTLATGQQLSATLVGTASPTADVAVVKIDKTGLPAARLGSINDLEVGDLAVAIGSPFGLSGTVTAGVISALHRNITLGAGERFADAIQTDAPINPGNSGGALADSDGKVVGINTAILGGAGGNVGVGFAIPIDIARRVADQIIRTGKASLPYIGISGQNLPDDRGALVQEVVSGGPAAGAGLQPGDIIVELAGKRIRSMDELISTLIQRRVGETVTFVYTRNGVRRTARAKLIARPVGS